jgi:hypothetical protein
MEWNVLSEPNVQGLEEKNVQIEEKVRKKRSQEDKIGRLKYHEVLTKRVLGQNEQILAELRWIRHKLKSIGESDLDVPMLQKYAVKDQVDLEILERIRQVGVQGIFPKDVANDPAFSQYGLKYYDISRRIVRMNKRLHFETGECLFEKRGHKWALTSFAFEVWGETEKEVM